MRTVRKTSKAKVTRKRRVKKRVRVIRTEEQLLIALKRFWESEYLDIEFDGTFDNKFRFAGVCIDRRLMCKLLKNGRVKILSAWIQTVDEFLIQYTLGTVDDCIRFYHVERGCSARR